MMTTVQILRAIERGEPDAVERLFKRVYAELRADAERAMASELPGHTLEPGALVHEVFLKLFESGQTLSFADRRHFFGAASRAMQEVLIDAARRKHRIKRGGDRRREPLPDEVVDAVGERKKLWQLNSIELHAALAKFQKLYPEKAEIVRLHIFSDLSLAKIAQIQEVPFARVRRSWDFARAWLRCELASTDQSEEAADGSDDADRAAK
jgi:RNA polymerase sigma factor (TIGR02999 family)